MGPLDFPPGMLGKAQLIRLVRRAQAERDPATREALWRMVRQAGTPLDATVYEPPTTPSGPQNEALDGRQEAQQASGGPSAPPARDDRS